MKKIVFALLMAGLTISFASCEKEIDLGNEVDMTKYQAAVTPKVGIRNDEGRAYMTNIELRGDAKTYTSDFTLALSRKGNETIQANLEIGTSVLVDNYNAANGTDFKAFPVSNAEIDESTVVIAKGALGSDEEFPLTLTLNVDGLSLEENTVYLLPIVVRTSDGALSGDPHYVFVKDYRMVVQDNTKYLVGTNQTMKIINCMEINHTSALFSLSFTLKKTGQYIFDGTVLFDSGQTVKFNEETGELMNSQAAGSIAQARRYEEIIKVMHDHGTKVIIPIVSNACCQLQESACKEYAKRLADYCRAYHIDGIFLDSEYTTIDSSRPGFTSANGANAARLCYEFKKLCPDCWTIVYLYSTVSSACSTSVDGHPASDFIDYAVNDYGRTTVPSMMGNSRTGIYSDNCSSYAPVYTNDTSRANSILSGKYGMHMMYCLEESTWAQTAVQNAIKNWASIWFGDTLVYNHFDNTVSW